MNTFSVFVVGAFLRLAVPLMVTALIVYLLRRLDVRWQAEAGKECVLLLNDDMPCWKEQGFSAAEIKMRAAQNTQPCWQTYRLSNGYLREACLDCEVFLSAPAPAVVHLHSHS
jgi:hypothetical protein